MVLLLLGINDLNVVYNKVKPIAAHWKDFSNLLYIRPATIDVIEADCGSSESRLRKVLEHWLKKDYNYEFYGSPCWRRVCVAVKEGGGNTALAEDIAREHPLPASTGGESSTGKSSCRINFNLLFSNCHIVTLNVIHVRFLSMSIRAIIYNFSEN